MKKRSSIVLLGLVLIAAFLSALILLPKVSITSGMERFLGTRVRIGKVYLDLKNSALVLKNFKVYNPKGFVRSEVLADLSEIHAEYDIRSPFKNGKLHFVKVRIFMKTLAVTKYRDGRFNVDALKMVKWHQETAPIYVDRVILDVDDVVYKQYLKDGKVDIQLYKVNIRKRDYDDLPDLERIVMQILFESLHKAAIKGAFIYGIAAVVIAAESASLVGSIALPIGVAIALSGEDSYSADFKKDYEYVFETSFVTAKEFGKSIYTDKDAGIIKFAVADATLSIKISKTDKNMTKLNVSAREAMLPMPRIAAGILYEISQKIMSL